MEVKEENIPVAMKERRQWVLWKEIVRDGKPTKIPVQIDGGNASSTDPATWCGFALAMDSYRRGGVSGIGYVFSEDDPFCGIDLDGCAANCSNVQPWAKAIIDRLNTYAEWSPSGCGIKLICEAKLPLKNGKNKKLTETPVSDKSPGIEVYDHGRFFAITGARGGKCPHNPEPRQDAIEQLVMEHWPMEMTLTRARRYCEVIEPAISGQGGSKVTSKVAVALVKGFGLNENLSLEIMREWNAKCQPPWNERELMRKIRWAQCQGGTVGYLRDANSKDWHTIDVPFTEQQSVGVGAAMDTCVEALDELDARGQRTVIAALQARYR